MEGKREECRVSKDGPKEYTREANEEEDKQEKR